jgi:hypothetical protein
MSAHKKPPPERAMSAYKAVGELVADVVLAGKLHDSSAGNPFFVRTYIRTVFAFIEGAAYVMRTAAQDLLVQRASVRNWQDAQKSVLLSSRAAKILPNGRITDERMRQPFKHMLAFTIRTLAEELGEDTSKLLSDNGWQSLQDAIDIRDRLTHPKQVEEVQVSQGELQKVLKGQGWFQDVTLRLLAKHQQIVLGRTKKGTP